MGYEWDFSIVLKYSDVLLEGLLGTLRVGVVSLILGAVGGLILALMRMSRYRLASWPAIATETQSRQRLSFSLRIPTSAEEKLAGLGMMTLPILSSARFWKASQVLDPTTRWLRLDTQAAIASAPVFGRMKVALGKRSLAARSFDVPKGTETMMSGLLRSSHDSNW